MTMKQTIAILFSTFVFLLAGNLMSQSSPGSIQASWEKAAKNKPVEIKPPLQQTKQTKTGEYNPVWEKQRSAPTAPWPYLPKAPSATQYHDANTMIIDSLQTLYCLSTNYLRSLRARNESAYGATQPESKKDFQYSQPPQREMRNESIARESLSTIHEELITLLQNCVYGR